MHPQNNLGRIGLFLALTVLFSGVFYAFIIATGHVGGGNGAYELGLMWSPALAAVLACKFSGLSLKALGWGWGPWKWQWLAFVIPLAYTAVAYGAVWAAGLGDFPDPTFVAKTREGLGWTGAPDWLVLAGYTALMAGPGMAMSLAFALGEEIGWRGFLAPHMTARFGLRAGAVLTGVLWTAWHLPLVLFADYNTGTPWWYGAGCLGVLLIGMSVIMAWLRSVSGSLWTAAIFHASHNQFIQTVFTPATKAHGPITAYAIDEFGFALPAVVLVIAVGFWFLRPRPAAAEVPA